MSDNSSSFSIFVYLGRWNLIGEQLLYIQVCPKIQFLKNSKAVCIQTKNEITITQLILFLLFYFIFSFNLETALSC